MRQKISQFWVIQKCAASGNKGIFAGFGLTYEASNRRRSFVIGRKTAICLGF
jgi:hypothetical protein